MNFVQGFQTDRRDPTRLKASAACKHFLAYSFENNSKTDRYHVSVNVSVADLEETFMPPFRACVLEGQASGLMCAYVSVNGVPACASPELRQLRIDAAASINHHGLYVTSDCEAVYDVLHKHHYTSNASQTIRDVLEAGMDLE